MNLPSTEPPNGLQKAISANETVSQKVTEKEYKEPKESKDSLASALQSRKREGTPSRPNERVMFALNHEE